MVNSLHQDHVYVRTIEARERSSLSVVASLIVPGSTVLDLGTGSGALGRHLSTEQGCTVDGITFNAQEAALARPDYRRLEVANLESCDLGAMFAQERYDVIVCADVLEHIRQPERIIAACSGLLRPQGQLIISVPNAAYCGLVGELLAGDFRYRDEGLLDRTHVRFFTRASLLRFLNEAGWALDHIETIRRELNESEFKLAFDTLPPAVANFLLAVPDALSYQFVLTANPPGRALPESAGGISVRGASATAVDTAPAHALFSAQLFLGHEAVYTEAEKLTASGVIGQAHQTLVFDLPAVGPAITSLRFDPADRPGFLYLHRMTLRTATGQLAWQWDSGADGLASLQSAAQNDVLLHPTSSTSTAALALLCGDDPWFELPIPDTVFAQPEAVLGARLEIELGWPMSADYLALAGEVRPLQNRISIMAAERAQERSELEQRAANDIRQLAQRHDAERDDAARLLAQTRQDSDEQLAQARAAHASQLEQTTTEARRQMVQLRELHDAVAAQRTRLQAEVDRLGEHLSRIENSLGFRVLRQVFGWTSWKDAKPRELRYAATGTAQDGAGMGGAGGSGSVGGTVSNDPLGVAGLAHPRKQGQPVDIIVPVYRGFEETQRCIESVLGNACKTPYRLIVINDASPEPDITLWLQQLQARDDRLVLLENAANLGFVATVNRGMAVSDTHDVVLLNSDAEVANDWLDRLARAAYTHRRVATVTPFSNNATICSYPRFCETNALPAGHDTASLDQLLARTNAAQVIDVPTAVGFCMYIRRDCLQHIGLFDAATFGKGYGEENDFCCRAAAAGWRNLHSLDIFVRHAGGVSFGASKGAREQAAMDSLRRLHPDYERSVHQFIALDPARQARRAADIARIQTSPLPVVLAVLHDRAGGTVRHVKELAAHLANQALFLCLTPAPGGRLDLKWLDDREALQLAFDASTEFDALVLALKSLGVGHVHFHHLLGHGQQVLDLPSTLGVAYDFTAHDYFAYCPQISLTDHTNAYCGERGIAQCRACLQHSPAPGGVDIETWRARHARLLNGARHVFTPSDDTARRFAKMFPGAPVMTVPHTDLLDKPAQPVRPPSRVAPDKPLRIAVIGALSAIKGADILEDTALAAARDGLLLEFHLLGYGYRDLLQHPQTRLTVHGPYAEDDLPALLAGLKPDVVWFPALWPETYSYTLSAALESGLPIVAPDLGAFTERLKGRDLTWVKPWDTPAAEWVTFFMSLRKLLSDAPVEAPTRQSGVPTDQPPVHLETWSYAQNYLAGVAKMAVVQPAAALNLVWRTQRDADHGIRHRAKQTLLHAVIYLRSTPGFRRIAREIPLRWQTRLKSWLRS